MNIPMDTVRRAGVRLPLLGTEDFSSGVKRSRSEGDYSIAFYYTGQEWWSYISTPPHVPKAWCVIKHIFFFIKWSQTRSQLCVY
jgi:hypothetical protein